MRILRISGQIAAPVRVAPPAAGIALDVGRRPVKAGTNPDVSALAWIGLHADPPRGGEIRDAVDRSSRASATRVVVDGADVGRAETEKSVPADLAVMIP